MWKDWIRLSALTDANECNLIHFVLFSKKIWTGRFKSAPPAPRVARVQAHENNVLVLKCSFAFACARGTHKQHSSFLGSTEKVLLPVEHFLNRCTRIKDCAGSWSCTGAAGTVSWLGRGIFLNTLRQSFETKHQSTSDCLILADWMGMLGLEASIHQTSKRILGISAGWAQHQMRKGYSTEP